MRAIDADAIEYTHAVARNLFDGHNWNELVVTKDEIEDMPTIQPEPHWIPVEQALPQIGEYVLCETTTRYFGKYHVCKFVDKDKWVDKPHFDWDRHGFPHVVAWTRFEPYKGVTI